MKKISYFLCIVLVLFGSYIGFKKYEKLHRPYLTVMGFIEAADGLGRQSMELINVFKDETSLNFIPTRGQPVLRDVPLKVQKIVKSKNRKLGKIVIFEDSLWSPGHNNYKKIALPKQADQIRIAYSMFESTQLPTEWPLILNSYFDAVVVPDKFLLDVYKNSGVDLPIFVLPLGLEFEHMFKEPLKKEAGKPFVFANLSSSFDRKNHLVLIRAFAKVFANNPEVVLKINSRFGDETIQEIQKEISNLKLSNVYYSNKSLDNASYLELFQSIDCYVSLSKGEGFSIQPREAMALGIPVIVTANTAQKTICESGLVRSVASSHLQPSLYPWGLFHGDSFCCTEEDAARALVDVYENYSLYLSKAENARSWVEKYQFKQLMPRYRNLIKPKKIILGAENQVTADFFMTNNKVLYDKYVNLVKK